MAGVPSHAGCSGSSEIRIANRLSEIERVADLIDEFGARHNLSNEIIVALNVSLDEIINNIISYGYEDAGDHNITVRVKLRSADVEIVIEDDGKPFNPLLAPEPDFNHKSRLGGVGLHFVRKLMDHLEYVRRGGVNQLRLRKKISES